MGQKEKLIARCLEVPSDLTYEELARFVGYFGYQEITGGKTGGSRRRFVRQTDQSILFLHKPHPGNIVGRATLRDVLNTLKRNGDLDEYTQV